MSTQELNQPKTDLVQTESSKKILVISFAMPPALNGSTFVIRNLASQFKSEDLIVAGERWRRNKAPGSEIDSDQFHYVWRQPNLGARAVKWIRRLMAPVILWRIWRLALASRTEVIVAVFPHEFYLLMGWLVSRLTGKPLVSYFHNTYAENRSGLALIYAKRLQSLVFRSSKVVFAMSDGMRDFLQERYPKVRFESLVHSHDVPESLNADATEQVSPVLKIAFIGNTNESNWDAFERFWDAVKEQDVEITMMSSTSPEQFAAHGINGPKVRFENVPFREEQAALRKHDVMFLPHGFSGGLSEAEYETIFPTKTISYLLTERPIIAHSPQRSFLTKWLNKNDCALVIEQTDPQAIRDGLNRIATDKRLRKTLVENGILAVQQFSEKRVSKFFARTISEVI